MSSIELLFGVKKMRGAEAFNAYYKEIYGERVDSLFASFRQELPKFPFRPFLGASSAEGPYFMDEASILAAKNLEAARGEMILDMCAAPGGKTLVIFDQMQGVGTLWSNELSSARRERLKKVITEYVPETFRSSLSVMGHDAIKYGLVKPSVFDRVLLDAPCSGEKHLLLDEKELSTWTKKRTERLAQNQYALLCSALLTVKSGGTILYSTCSISPLENDGVIEKVLMKKEKSVMLDLPVQPLGAERTSRGYIFLPDSAKMGPLYFSRLKKI